MTKRKPLTPEEISAIVDGFEPIDVEEMKIIARLTPSQRIFRMLEKAEAIRDGEMDAETFITKNQRIILPVHRSRARVYKNCSNFQYRKVTRGIYSYERAEAG